MDENPPALLKDESSHIRPSRASRAEAVDAKTRRKS